MKKKEITPGKTGINESTAYLRNESSNFRTLLNKLDHAQQCISNKGNVGPKHPVKRFNYELAVANEAIPENGRETQEVFTELSELVEGSFRVQSKNNLFNMIPNPLMDTMAASMLMQVHNVNAIMDSYGGKSLLFEQKVARSIGKLIGWEQAFGISCNGGKLTMFYAIKAAVRRLVPDYEKNGLPGDLVFLVPSGGHYSIEQTCGILGIGSKNCVRIPMDPKTGMKEEALREEFLRQVRRGKRVAAIISCGGTTIDFMHDDTQMI
ncbi:MAG: pyridoxal-dependent decarboxylase, partial [Cyclobacteriaceae bacterium]